MKDELLWAAAWLFRATGDEYYLKYVVDNAVSMGGTGWAVKEFSWDNKYAGVQILLSKVITFSHHLFKNDFYLSRPLEEKLSARNVISFSFLHLLSYQTERQEKSYPTNPFSN